MALCTSCETEALPTQIQTGRRGNSTFRALHSSRNIQVDVQVQACGLCSLPLRGQTSASDLPPSCDYQNIPQVNRFPEKPGTESFPRPLWQHKPRKISLWGQSAGHGPPALQLSPFNPTDSVVPAFWWARAWGPPIVRLLDGSFFPRPWLLHNPCSICLIGSNEVQLFPTPKALWFFVFWQSSEGKFNSFQCIFRQTINQNPFLFVLLMWKLKSDIAKNRQSSSILGNAHFSSTSCMRVIVEREICATFPCTVLVLWDFLGVKDALLCEKWLIVSHQNIAIYYMMNSFCHLLVSLATHQKHCPLLNYVAMPDILTFSFLAGVCPGASEIGCLFARKIGYLDVLCRRGVTSGLCKRHTQSLPTNTCNLQCTDRETESRKQSALPVNP